VAYEPLEYRFFLGANSAYGFYSYFEDAVTDPDIHFNYIHKGGPGCGKSTSMKRFLAHGIEQGETCEIIPCSSDPDSLDGVRFHKKGVAVYDGTAPHVIEMTFPGAQGAYITAPPFLSPMELKAKKEELQNTNAALAGQYAQVYRLLAAAGKFSELIYHEVADISFMDHLEKRAKGIIGREIPKSSGTGKCHRRFLGGITPHGLICYYESAQALAGKIYELEDPYGFAPQFLEPILKAALKNGYEVYACYDPLLPEHLQHLIIPALSLAFVSSNCAFQYSGDSARRINLAGVVENKSLRPIRGRIRLFQKLQLSLMQEACDELANTKKYHDKLEELYHPHLDFDALTKQTQQLIETLLK